MKLGIFKSLRKYSIPTLLSMGWLVIIALTAVLYPLISSVDPKAIYENDLAVGPFTNGHLFGTDTNGYRSEMIQLMKTAKNLSPATTQK